MNNVVMKIIMRALILSSELTEVDLEVSGKLYKKCSYLNKKILSFPS
jgi:hypothetical protein